MSRRVVVVRAPGRLHFGLLGWGPEAPRQFGGAGLMVDAPGLELTAEPAPDWSAEGPLAGRALSLARDLAASLRTADDRPISSVRLTIRRAPREHAGLGVGTQLALSVAAAMHALAGRDRPPAPVLAALTGRGRRSGIGLHGFDRGGLIVDGGHGPSGAVPPLVARADLPPSWRVLVVTPELPDGRHGPAERAAFADLPPTPRGVADRCAAAVLLGLLPAAAEADLPAFGAAVEELQSHVGRAFAPAQGGPFAHPGLAALAADLRAIGLCGVGQSSWGPTLYAFADRPTEHFDNALADLRARHDLPPGALTWTASSPAGATLTTDPPSP